jgi:MFS family permease
LAVGTVRASAPDQKGVFDGHQHPRSAGGQLAADVSRLLHGRAGRAGGHHALPAIHAQLGGSLATLEWAVNAYGLTFAAGIITASALGDRLGRRQVYVAGLILFSVASAACALAPAAATLIGARALQGVGAAVVTPLSLTILTSSFPAAKRGAVAGIWGGIAGLAVAGGPLVGGAIVQGLSWHWIFWVNVPVGFVAAAASARLLPESHGPARRLDLPALPLIAGAALTLTWGLVRADASAGVTGSPSR